MMTVEAPSIPFTELPLVAVPLIGLVAYTAWYSAYRTPNGTCYDVFVQHQTRYLVCISWLLCRCVLAKHSLLQHPSSGLLYPILNHLLYLVAILLQEEHMSVPMDPNLF